MHLALLPTAAAVPCSMPRELRAHLNHSHQHTCHLHQPIAACSVARVVRQVEAGARQVQKAFGTHWRAHQGDRTEAHSLG